MTLCNIYMYLAQQSVILQLLLKVIRLLLTSILEHVMYVARVFAACSRIVSWGWASRLNTTAWIFSEMKSGTRFSWRYIQYQRTILYWEVYTRRVLILSKKEKLKCKNSCGTTCLCSYQARLVFLRLCVWHKFKPNQDYLLFSGTSIYQLFLVLTGSRKHIWQQIVQARSFHHNQFTK